MLRLLGAPRPRDRLGGALWGHISSSFPAAPAPSGPLDGLWQSPRRGVPQRAQPKHSPSDIGTERFCSAHCGVTRGRGAATAAPSR